MSDSLSLMNPEIEEMKAASQIHIVLVIRRVADDISPEVAEVEGS